MYSTPPQATPFQAYAHVPFYYSPNPPPPNPPIYSTVPAFNQAALLTPAALDANKQQILMTLMGEFMVKAIAVTFNNPTDQQRLCALTVLYDFLIRALSVLNN